MSPSVLQAIKYLSEVQMAGIHHLDSRVPFLNAVII